MIIEADLGKGSTTHMGVLVKILHASSGDIVEFGTGPFSTPLLHWLCKDMNRRLVSYEDNPKFYDLARGYTSRHHKIIFVENWNSIDTRTHRGVIFIDQSLNPVSRGELAVRFKDSADYVVMHDTEAEDTYDYKKVWPNFKYSYTWKECRPWVSVVSNFKDLAWLDPQNNAQSQSLKDLLTVLYYTSNREKPEFEQKIINNLLEVCGDLPIVSVSQRPLALGRNICVGDVGLSYLNEWRQILIGAKEVKTPYIIFAESDFLYPKEYFSFFPPKRGLYRYTNVWVVFKDVTIAGSYRKKPCSEGAQIADRDLLIKTYEQFLSGKPEWIDGHAEELRVINEDDFLTIHNMPFEFFGGEIACVTFKTGEGVRNSTAVLNGGPERSRRISLPYWGHVNTLRAKYL